LSPKANATQLKSIFCDSKDDMDYSLSEIDENDEVDIENFML